MLKLHCLLLVRLLIEGISIVRGTRLLYLRRADRNPLRPHRADGRNPGVLRGGLQCANRLKHELLTRLVILIRTRRELLSVIQRTRMHRVVLLIHLQPALLPDDLLHPAHHRLEVGEGPRRRLAIHVSPASHLRERDPTPLGEVEEHGSDRPRPPRVCAAQRSL